MEESYTATAAACAPRDEIPVTRLRRDSGCARLLNWRCDLPCGIDAGALERVFEASGYRSMSKHPALKVFRHPEGHDLAWVVTTGRVQIRVALAIEPPKREQVAHDLYMNLVDLVRHCPTRLKPNLERGSGPGSHSMTAY